MLAASAMALSPLAGSAMAKQLGKMKRPSVIYLSFQECTGCLESLTRSFSPTLEHLIFNVISLDYDDTLMAAAGHQAEAAKEQAMRDNYGKYVLVVDGAIPLAFGGACHTAAGKSAIQILKEAAKGARAIVAVGTCATFGGLPHANPNPTGAIGVSDLIKDKPVINVSGCPPIPVVMAGTIMHFFAFDKVPELDELHRPKMFYGNTIHDRCYRRPFYDAGKFAESFDDEGARNGWCLYKLGCKGPTTYNSCATLKWNQGVSFPIESGHPCLGCSQPNFWDGGSFYAALPTPKWGKAGEGNPSKAGEIAGAAAGIGAGVGLAAAGLSRYRQYRRAIKAAAAAENGDDSDGQSKEE
jgi:hydrogenase small subunit